MLCKIRRCQYVNTAPGEEEGRQSGGLRARGPAAGPQLSRQVQPEDGQPSTSLARGSPPAARARGLRAHARPLRTRTSTHSPAGMRPSGRQQVRKTKLGLLGGSRNGSPEKLTPRPLAPHHSLLAVSCPELSCGRGSQPRGSQPGPSAGGGEDARGGASGPLRCAGTSELARGEGVESTGLPSESPPPCATASAQRPELLEENIRPNASRSPGEGSHLLSPSSDNTVGRVELPKGSLFRVISSKGDI